MELSAAFGQGRSGSSAPAKSPPGRGRIGDRQTVAVLGALLIAELALAVEIWEPSHWRPLSLVAVLIIVTAIGELDAVRIGSVYVSSTSCALLLALVLLGPVPAATIAAATTALDWAVRRKALWAGLTNVVVAASATLLGGLTIDLVAGSPPHDDGGRFAIAVFLAGIAMAAANLLLLGTLRQLRLGTSFRAALVESYLPTLPYHLLGITLATAAAQIVVAGGFPTLAAVVPALLVSEVLLRFVSAERAQAEQVMALTNDRAELLEQTLTAEVAEREWLAGHVHDDTLQTLAAARQDIDDAIAGEPAALVEAREHLDRAVLELRRTLLHVDPGSVAGSGLGPALEVYADQVLRRTGASWDVRVDPNVGGEHVPLLYSLARELLGNAAKHAAASRVELRIGASWEGVRLLVSDDGIGFTPAEPTPTGRHFGLLIARRRVAAAGGRMTIAPGRGGGTSIDVVLPVSG